MEWTTLYRKYRPLDFETVVGQDHIVKTLKNQIVNNKIAHAYLFSGTRGTGKTTIAKIFARSINCPNEQNGNPCNFCDTCTSSLNGTNLNIIEMDAASNGNVEAVRHIGELIEYPPINGEKYKVFIIDEAHALTREATQSFLKILEEPPEYVVYILATTDPNMLPETILSRCQKYNFKRITIEMIVEYLKNVCEKEKIDIDVNAIEYIAEKADGSMRESLSMLDRCRAYVTGETLTKKIVLDILGVVGDDDFTKLTISIINGDIKEAFLIVAQCIDKGKDIVQFINDYIKYLRDLLIVKELSGPVEELNITKTNFDKLKKESENINTETLIYYIKSLSKTANVMKIDENRRVLFETEIIRLATPSSDFMEEAVLSRLSSVEDKISSGSYIRREIVKEELKEKDVVKEDVVKQEIKEDENKYNIDNDDNKSDKQEKQQDTQVDNEELKSELLEIIKNWNAIASKFNQPKRTYIGRAKVELEDIKGLLIVKVVISDMVAIKFDKYEMEKELNEIVKTLFNKDVQFDCVLKSQKVNEVKKKAISIEDALSKIDIEIGEESD